MIQVRPKRPPKGRARKIQIALRPDLAKSIRVVAKHLGCELSVVVEKAWVRYLREELDEDFDLTLSDTEDTEET